ncbi:MAG: ABC transporter permease [Bacteroidota bacterium]
MLTNYFLVAWRSLLQHRVFSLINVAGLSIGIAAFWMILHYVYFETSYEDFNAQSQSTYRVQLDVYRSGSLVYQSSENYPGVGQAMMDELPEVIDFGRLYNMGAKNNINVTWYDAPIQPVTIKQDQLLYADASVLGLLGYEMLEGEITSALSQPFKMVISETMARNYFGREQALGKYLRLEDDDFNNELCEVTGVFRDSPDNTHLKFHVLISTETLYGRDNGEGWAKPRYKTGWGRKDFYTYVRLAPGTHPSQVERKLPAIVDKFRPDLAAEGGKDVLKLQAISDIHLYSRLTDEAEVNGNGQAVYYLGIIAAFILLIAWINYINLSTAKAMDRAKEIGLRKVMGAYRSRLITQFLIESIVINAIALIIAMFLVLLLTPVFNNLGGTPSNHILWVQPFFLISVPILLLIGGLLSGLYPAFILSRFQPVTALRGKVRNAGGGLLLRKFLVTLQFTASVGLIIATVIVFQQMDHMQHRDLGFAPEQVIVIARPSVRDTSFSVVRRNIDSFRNGLINETDIVAVGGSMTVPGKKVRFKAGTKLTNASDDQLVPFGLSMMDYGLASVLDFEFVAGRNFDRSFVSDPDTAIIINEKGALALGFQNPQDAVGKGVFVPDFNWSGQIVGVMKDYHQESLQEEILPLFLGLNVYGVEHYLVKVETKNYEETIQKVKSQWEASFGNNPFDYFFLDEFFNSRYQSEQQFRNLFTTFSVLAIFVSCLGLFGLSLFNTVQRSKEIGVRKVLGATVSHIVLLFASDAIKILLMANLLAWPVTYFFMRDWLANYAYQAPINLLVFAGAGLLVVGIASLTVSLQVLRSARANPVEALKYE